MPDLLPPSRIDRRFTFPVRGPLLESPDLRFAVRVCETSCQPELYNAVPAGSPLRVFKFFSKRKGAHAGASSTLVRVRPLSAGSCPAALDPRATEDSADAPGLKLRTCIRAEGDYKNTIAQEVLDNSSRSTLVGRRLLHPKSESQAAQPDRETKDCPRHSGNFETQAKLR